MKFIASALLALAFASSVLAADAVKLTRVYEKLETKWPIAVVIPPARSGAHFAKGRAKR
jgi:hypothetical protein